MKWKMMTAAVLCGLICANRGFSAGAIITNENKRIDADTIEADDKGNLTYRTGNITMKMKAGEYKMARVSKPKVIDQAASEARSGDWGRAAELYRQAYTNYRFLGWDAYCLFYEGYCLLKAGKKPDAARRLALLDEIDLQDPNKEKFYYDGKKMLAETYIELSRFDEALKTLESLASSDSEDIAPFSFNQRGRIMEKKGKTKDAVLMYMQTALLFPKENPYRPEALFKIASLLKSMKDARAVKFEEMLKSDYPDSKYLSQLQ